MNRSAPLLAVLLIICLSFGGAEAQQGPRPFRLQEMNFDLWCQETQQLPPERCDQRLPADDAAFQAYENKMEAYEIDYLKRHAQDRSIDRNILHYDPIDHPREISAPQTDRPAGQ